MTGSDSGPFGQASSAYSVNGGHIEYNNMEVDGIRIIDMGTGGEFDRHLPQHRRH